MLNYLFPENRTLFDDKAGPLEHFHHREPGGRVVLVLPDRRREGEQQSVE